MEKRNWRGTYYVLIVDYKGKNYNTKITSNEYYGIDEGVFPDLYYADKNDTVFSRWDMVSYWRSIILFSVACIIVVVAWIVYRYRRQS